MWSDRVLNPGRLALESDALQAALRSPSFLIRKVSILYQRVRYNGKVSDKWVTNHS